MHSRVNVFAMVDALQSEDICRIMLPDTLGVLSPRETRRFVKAMVEHYPHLRFDYHAHNDYDLAVANVLAAVEEGCSGVHCTVNGLGERAGAANQPIVGENVFTQTAGVHADGDKKAGLYVNRLLPERFGRSREYALGKMSGKANIEQNLRLLGISLSEEDMKKVTRRINELGDKKEKVSIDDLPFIISDVLHHGTANERIKLVSYMVSTAYGLHPQAVVKLEVNGKQYEESATGDGQYDAFVRAVRHIPWLSNYQVTIPPGGRTDALVQTAISWQYEGKTYRTRGLDADQTEAAIKATIKMLNLLEE